MTPAANFTGTVWQDEVVVGKALYESRFTLDEAALALGQES